MTSGSRIECVVLGGGKNYATSPGYGYFKMVYVTVGIGYSDQF